MLVSHQMRIDLTGCGCQPVAHAVQGEANTRQLIISLFANSISWVAPSGATAAVAFLKPDGTKGLYDKLPDGSNATTISGNTVTAILAPQVLTCAGTVLTSIIFYDAEGDTLATFPFRVLVEKNPAAGEQISNNYYTLQNLDQVNQAYNNLSYRVEVLERGSDSGHNPSPGAYYIATDYDISTAAEDNTAAMQALIDLVSARGGGVIWLPVGIYRFNAAASTALTTNVQTCLAAKNNVSILGENLAETIIQVYGATEHGAAWIASLNTTVTSGCSFERFTVDMSESVMTTYTHKGKAFYLSGIENCIFRDLRLINTPSTALGIDMLNNVVIDSVYVYRGGREWIAGGPGGAGIGIGTGMWKDENFIIRNCTCIECGHFGIFLEDQGLFRSTPEHNYPNGQTITNNIIRGCRNYGLGVRGGKNVVVTGNNIYNNSGGLYLDYGAKNVLISGNLVADSSEAAVRFGTEDTRPGFGVLPCENVVIIGNTFIGNPTDVLTEREPINTHFHNNVVIPGAPVAPTRISLGGSDMIPGIKLMPDGSESPADTAVSTDYLDVSGMGTNIRITTMGITDSVRIAQYGADKNALESDTTMRGVPTYQTEKTTELVVAKVEGCAYIRMFYTSYNSVDPAVIQSIVVETAQ